MYELKFLPIALQDLTEIVRYISLELQNPTAANQLIVELAEAADRAAELPYANPVYAPLWTLDHEYRTVRVKNYMMFYQVIEEEKTVVILRVIYAKRNFDSLLK